MSHGEETLHPCDERRDIVVQTELKSYLVFLGTSLQGAMPEPCLAFGK